MNVTGCTSSVPRNKMRDISQIHRHNSTSTLLSNYSNPPNTNVAMTTLTEPPTMQHRLEVLRFCFVNNMMISYKENLETKLLKHLDKYVFSLQDKFLKIIMKFLKLIYVFS